MPATTAFKNSILDYVFGGDNTPNPIKTTFYWGLSTTTIAADGTGATEPLTANGYARVTYTNNKTNWGDAVDGSLVNDVAVTFTECTTNPWGDVTYLFIAESGTRGTADIIWYELLSPTIPVIVGTVVEFDAGTITVSM